MINKHLKGETNKTNYLPVGNTAKADVPLAFKIGGKYTFNRLVVSTPYGIDSFYLHTTKGDSDLFGSPSLPLSLYHSWYDDKGVKHEEKISTPIKSELPKYKTHISIGVGGIIKTSIKKIKV